MRDVINNGPFRKKQRRRFTHDEHQRVRKSLKGFLAISTCHVKLELPDSRVAYLEESITLTSPSTLKFNCHGSRWRRITPGFSRADMDDV
jgi:hypothetical protein